jgi:large subunit ribosomal protein L4
MSPTSTDAPVASIRRKERPEPSRRAVHRRKSDGTILDTVVLAPEIFGLEPNTAVLHQVITSQLAAARSGTQSTLTRAEVRGGGAKPFRQKGTGRSRQGSTRSPHWSGGGVAMGPKPRSYRQRTPKKMIRLALFSALSDRASEGKVVLLDSWGFEEPKTKKAVASLDALGLYGKVLVVVDPEDGNTQRSFSNLQSVQVTLAGELSAYDVLRNDWVIFEDSTLLGETQEATESDLVIDPEPDPRAVAVSEDGEEPEEEVKAKGKSRSKAKVVEDEASAEAEEEPAAEADADSEVVGEEDASADEDASAEAEADADDDDDSEEEEQEDEK